MYEKKITDLMKQLQDERARSESAEQQLDLMKEQLTGLQELMQVDHLYWNALFSFEDINL